MTDEPTELEDDGDETLEDAGTIGVGMGGSCPSCRAPVDLGQEFCLECGAPIRFTPRQRRRQRAAATTATMTARTTPAPSRGKVPWIPILVVMALIGSGIAFALTDGDRPGGGSTTSSTEDALPEITNSVPQTTSTTSTVTLQDCDPAQPLAGTEPTIPGGVNPSVNNFGDGEQIPELSENGTGAPGGGSDPFADPARPGAGIDGQAAPPSTTPSTGGTTVTVDQDGNLCSNSGGSDAPLDDDPSDAPDGSSGDAPTSSGDWPAGRNGWTAIVFGYPTRERATQSALDLQQDGFTDGGVLFSSDFRSLCPGFHVVYSGVFDSEADAKRRKSELEKQGYVNVYPREIRNDGAPASGCTSTS